MPEAPVSAAYAFEIGEILARIHALDVALAHVSIEDPTSRDWSELTGQPAGQILDAYAAPTSRCDIQVDHPGAAAKRASMPAARMRLRSGRLVYKAAADAVPVGP